MTDKMLEAFAGTRKAGAIASGALDEVTKIVKPGVTTEETRQKIKGEKTCQKTDGEKTGEKSRGKKTAS